MNDIFRNFNMTSNFCVPGITFPHLSPPNSTPTDTLFSHMAELGSSNTLLRVYTLTFMMEAGLCFSILTDILFAFVVKIIQV